jgi:hypothetical protein
MSLQTRQQRRTMIAEGITHALTWRPARTSFGETTGFWALYTTKQYLDRHRCGGALAWVYDDDIADLPAWVATAVGFAADLESVDVPVHPFGDTAIETRFWIRRTS